MQRWMECPACGQQTSTSMDYCMRCQEPFNAEGEKFVAEVRARKKAEADQAEKDASARLEKEQQDQLILKERDRLLALERQMDVARKSNDWSSVSQKDLEEMSKLVQLLTISNFNSPNVLAVYGVVSDEEFVTVPVSNNQLANERATYLDLANAKRNLSRNLRLEALKLGGNVIWGFSLNYTQIGSFENSSLMMVSASGTVVSVSDKVFSKKWWEHLSR